MVTSDTRRERDDQDPWILAEDLAARLPGVSSVVITAQSPDGDPVEIQVFGEPSIDRNRLRDQVSGLVREVTAHDGPMRVIVLELAEASPPAPPSIVDLSDDRLTADHGASDADEPTADHGAADADEPTANHGASSDRIALLAGARPVLVAADVRRRRDVAHATVLLVVGGKEVTGSAERPSSTHDLAVVAEATLDALSRAASGARDVGLRGAVLAEMLQARAVCVRLSRDEPADRELFGAALVDDDDHAAATARATLDALNRQL